MVGTKRGVTVEEVLVVTAQFCVLITAVDP